jgi:hypothetical protein
MDIMPFTLDVVMMTSSVGFAIIAVSIRRRSF